MENTHDPRDFYRVTKVLLVPLLWNESFGLVAAEAMINGIPVLASDRGALREVVGTIGGQGLRVEGQMDTGGFLFHIPANYTPETVNVPTAEEVGPWVETIIRLWDDDALCRQCSEKSRAHSRQWHADRLASVYGVYFQTLHP
jgi:glycosyltransferase involved in cell wall biosynthesis